MAKSREAFRTISEVAEWLDTPAHVLRFWESKFAQIKPVKRAGGRRYYRPDDMALLGGIKTLLHEQGMTIKGVQKMLREQGARNVAALGPVIELDGDVAGSVVPADIPQARPRLTTPASYVSLAQGREPLETAANAAASAHAAVAAPPATERHRTQGDAPDRLEQVTPADAAPPPRPTAEPEAAPARPVHGATTAADDGEPGTVAEGGAPAATRHHAPSRQDAMRRVLESLPDDPADDSGTGTSRFFAAFFDADPDLLRGRADEFAPLYARLLSLRDRIAQARE